MFKRKYQDFIIDSCNKERIGFLDIPNETLIIPETFRYKWKWYRVVGIHSCAFLDCNNLVSVIMPDSITHIDCFAFGDCKSLEVVKLPKNIKEIGVGAFCDCDNLKSITIPNNKVKIKVGAFDENVKINILEE